jgi:hypothetical protein
VSSHLPIAVPVLHTAEWVFIPASRLARAVQVMATVNWRWGVNTVVVADVTDWSLSTLNIFRVITAVIYRIKHCCFWVIICFWTETVLGLGICIKTVPECSTVELVRKPSWAKVLAVNMLIIRSAVCLSCWCGFTVLVTFITHWPSSTDCLLFKVATHVARVKHGGCWVILRLRTHDMLSLMLPLGTVPECSAVILISVVPSAMLSITAVYLLAIVNAVLLRGGGGDWVGTVLRIVTRTVTAFHVIRVSAPLMRRVKLKVVFACLMSNTASIALVVLIAALGVCNHLEVILSTN